MSTYVLYMQTKVIIHNIFLYFCRALKLLLISELNQLTAPWTLPELGSYTGPLDHFNQRRNLNYDLFGATEDTFKNTHQNINYQQYYGLSEDVTFQLFCKLYPCVGCVDKDIECH